MRIFYFKYFKFRLSPFSTAWLGETQWPACFSSHGKRTAFSAWTTEKETEAFFKLTHPISLPLPENVLRTVIRKYGVKDSETTTMNGARQYKFVLSGPTSRPAIWAALRSSKMEVTSSSPPVPYLCAKALLLSHCFVEKNVKSKLVYFSFAVKFFMKAQKIMWMGIRRHIIKF